MFWRRSERERDRERNRRREETLDRLVGLDPEQRSAVVAEAVMAGEIDRHEADDLLRTAARLQAVDTMTLSGWSAALAGRVHDELASGLTDVSPAAPLGEIAIDPWAYSDEDELIAIPIEPAYPPAYEAAYPARYEVAYETEYDEATAPGALLV